MAGACLLKRRKIFSFFSDHHHYDQCPFSLTHSSIEYFSWLSSFIHTWFFFFFRKKSWQKKTRNSHCCLMMREREGIIVCKWWWWLYFCRRSSNVIWEWLNEMKWIFLSTWMYQILMSLSLLSLFRNKKKKSNASMVVVAEFFHYH